MGACPDKVGLLSHYVEGELPARQREVLERHLRSCAVCRQELGLLRRTVEVLEQLPLETAPSDFLDKLRRRMAGDERLRRLEEERRQAHMAADSPSVAAAGERWLAAGQRKSPGSGVGQPWLSRLGRTLFFPTKVTIPAYAAIATALGLSAVLLRSSLNTQPDGQHQSPEARAKSTRGEPSPERLAEAQDRLRGPRPEPQDEQGSPVAVPSAPLASLEGTVPVVEPIVWRVAVGANSQAARERARVLVSRIVDAMILQEPENTLVISLPTNTVSAFRRDLRELGQVSGHNPQAGAAGATTVLNLTFGVSLDPLAVP